MKKCKKCGSEFEPKKGLKNYCSLKCRNSRTWTEEDKIKKSESAKKSEKVMKQIKKLHTQYYIDKIKSTKATKKSVELSKQVFNKIKAKRKQTYKEKLLLEDFNTLSFERLRKRVIYEQNESCNKCGINEWLGENITLELDHINGNNKDNSRDNLEALCPNCHSQTKTWRGRNKSSNVNKISDEVLLSALIDKEFNMRQALLSVGLAAKGGNYNRCHRLLRECSDILDE
jgi:hypothetical protein